MCLTFIAYTMFLDPQNAQMQGVVKTVILSTSQFGNNCVQL